MFYEKELFPLICYLSKDDAEKAHEMGLAALKVLGLSPLREMASWITSVPNREVEVLGLRFPNPIGLAAGFDKGAGVIPGLSALSPGFVEIGTVVPERQEGNPRPRVFRYSNEEALINRLGFNSDGMEAVANRLAHFRRRRSKIPIGINVGANKDTPTERAYEDYVKCIRYLYGYADYITVNPSSPNTPGLRKLQHGELLSTLLRAVKAAMEEEGAKTSTKKPLFLKLALDLKPAELDAICAIARPLVSGLIIGNTTVSRPKGFTGQEEGGMSGKPLFRQMLLLVKHVHKHDPKLPIIAAGGISGPQDALFARDAGASLVQILTTFVYQGPLVFRNMNRHLCW